jgi:HK97 family phage portal protein
MNFFNLFQREKRQTLEEILISGGVLATSVSKDQALNIPALSACLDLICNTVASLPIYLYEKNGETIKIVDDPRTALLNDDTKDTLNAVEFKRALIEDYLLMGAGYAYINRSRNEIKSLNYVDYHLVSVNKNTDPIFKKYQIQVNGEVFRDFNFIKMVRKTKDGITGKGIIRENNVALSVAYNSMIYEESMVKTNGNKRGFLKAAGRLSPEAIQELKNAWKNLYKNTDENVVVLNNGLDFVEASQTSVELQLNEHKRSNSDEICKILLVPPSILNGNAKEVEHTNWIKSGIMPILSAFETALNKDMLLPSEKDKRFFAFDMQELMKGDIEKRFHAYEIGVKAGILQIDEVRTKEKLPPLGLKFVRLGLQDVLYFPDKEEIYTPNTNSKYDLNAPVPTPENQPNGGQQQNENVPNNNGFSQNNQQSKVPDQKAGNRLNNNSGNNPQQ